MAFSLTIITIVCCILPMLCSSALAFVGGGVSSSRLSFVNRSLELLAVDNTIHQRIVQSTDRGLQNVSLQHEIGFSDAIVLRIPLCGMEGHIRILKVVWGAPGADFGDFALTKEQLSDFFFAIFVQNVSLLKRLQAHFYALEKEIPERATKWSGNETCDCEYLQGLKVKKHITTPQLHFGQSMGYPSRTSPFGSLITFARSSKVVLLLKRITHSNNMLKQDASFYKNQALTERFSIEWLPVPLFQRLLPVNSHLIRDWKWRNAPVTF